MLLAATTFSFPESAFPPVALESFGLGTGYLIYGPQELFGFPRRDAAVTGPPDSGASGCPDSCSSWRG